MREGKERMGRELINIYNNILTKNNLSMNRGKDLSGSSVKPDIVNPLKLNGYISQHKSTNPFKEKKKFYDNLNI